MDLRSYISAVFHSSKYYTDQKIINFLYPFTSDAKAIHINALQLTASALSVRGCIYSI